MAPQTTTSPAGKHGTLISRPATFLDVVAAEWIKLRTHRAVLIALLIGAAVTVAAGADNAAANARWIKNGSGVLGNDPTRITLFGMKFGLIAFAIAGALAMTSEYSSGMIRTSLTAVPARGQLLAAKATAFTAAAMITGLIASVASFAIGSSLLSGAGVHVSPTDPGVLRAVIGGGLFLATVGLLGLALGAFLRNAVAAVSATFALFILPMVTKPPLQNHLPFEAGITITNASSATALDGYLTLLAWTATATGVAYLHMKHRDA